MPGVHPGGGKDQSTILNMYVKGVILITGCPLKFYSLAGSASNVSLIWNQLNEQNIVVCKKTTYVQNFSTRIQGFTLEDQRRMVMAVLDNIIAHLNADINKAAVNDPRLRFASNEPIVT